MISKLSKVAAVAALAMVMWPTARANALCGTGLSDSTNIDCKNALTCQNAIHKDIVKYYTAVQNSAVKQINDTQKGVTSKKPASKCIGGLKNGKACSTNNGLCKSTINKGKVCSVDADCDATVGSCDYTKGCNVAGSPDVFECQVDTAKSDYAKAIKVAQDNLRKDIIKQCNTSPKLVDPADLGLSNLATCPGIGTAPTTDIAYNALIECITDSQEGDVATGKTVDTTIYAFAKATGTGNLTPRGKKTDSVPRAVLQLAGAQSLQVGTGASADPISSGGGLTLLSGASCSNGNVYCLGHVDCANNGAGAADTCTPNSNTDPGCASGNPCRTLTAPGPIHAADPPNGNILTVSATCSANVATCLVTKTQNAGNGTPAAGFINFTAGEVGTTAPINTSVWITGLGVDCNTYVACPSCIAGVCSIPAGQLAPSPAAANACTASENQPTQECLPFGAPTANVPNPFTISTEPKNMVASVDVSPAPGFQPGFCGFCDSSATSTCQGGVAMCSHGCQTLADCAGVVGATVCDFGSTQPGFQGDVTVSSITADGVRNQYTPIVTGIFCTGVTGNGTIDGAAGLPGPVRVTLPYIQSYLYSTDP